MQLNAHLVREKKSTCNTSGATDLIESKEVTHNENVGEIQGQGQQTSWVGCFFMSHLNAFSPTPAYHDYRP